ncbi:hypothetical protein RJT34_23492 [Clitoria ternatea]|uniref:Uncharacterized protein n=1 Tax=Clitoria ternatea TaxID=43366 RepID=A0AAN9FUT1_CLITE
MMNGKINNGFTSSSCMSIIKLNKLTWLCLCRNFLCFKVPCFGFAEEMEVETRPLVQDLLIIDVLNLQINY